MDLLRASQINFQEAISEEKSFFFLEDDVYWALI